MKDKGNTQSTEVTQTNGQQNEITIIQPIETATNEKKYISKTRRRNTATNELMTIEETDKVLLSAYNEVLQLMTNKGIGIAKACKQIDNININSFFECVNFSAENLKQYVQSQELRAEKLGEQLHKYATNDTNDFYMNERGTMLPNAVRVQRDRLRYDAIKWQMSKLAPKKYGDNITVKGDADNPLQIVAIKGMIIQ